MTLRLLRLKCVRKEEEGGNLQEVSNALDVEILHGVVKCGYSSVIDHRKYWIGCSVRIMLCFAYNF